MEIARIGRNGEVPPEVQGESWQRLAVPTRRRPHERRGGKKNS